jgi:DNA primase
VAGRINAEDLAAVKERAAIESVVREHVTLRSAGAGSLKGLCPFHDEKTPSFTVRPALGVWHCFGCNEGGDVISFVQKVEHLGFAEAVERLAGSLGMTLRYDQTPGQGGRNREEPGRRGRLVEAHRVAAEFYTTTLLESAQARVGRDFMRARGFDSAAARQFAVGFAPTAGSALVEHLAAKGFSDDEMVTAGLAGRGRYGLYDRFRGRLLWPIRDITGDTVGFGARRLFDDDRIEAKYLNTSETPIYKKTAVLYGLDLAKKDIARERRAVVVEGYTDVMACHLSGVTTAVATCGTAFGVDHIKTLRRLIRDEADLAPAKVIFTFDGDAAGQKAAMRAFAEDQRWAAQSYVAVAPGGQDPCDLRLSAGEVAVRALVDDAVPMFEFVARTTIGRFDLDTAEGRVQAIKAVAPIVASIRDTALRPEYVRTVAGWLGVDVEQVAAAVQRAVRAAKDRPQPGMSAAPPPEHGSTPMDGDENTDPGLEPILPQPDLRDPVVAAERQLLQCVLQFPALVDADAFTRLGVEGFRAPAHRLVAAAVLAAGGPQTDLPAQTLLRAVSDQAPVGVQPLIAELAVANLPVRVGASSVAPERRVVEEILGRVREAGLVGQIANAMSAFRRMESAEHPDTQRSRDLAARLSILQRELADLRARESS